ncbi:MAG TPA: hypothetical protein VF545_02490 [Thermoleophilaceae bacterium]|jgi:hypothetical protein
MTRVAAAAALLTLAAAPSAAAAPYTTSPGPERAQPRFAVTYKGSGTYRTVFHGEPPNEGGDPDTNDAKDSSRQAWRLKFRRSIEFPDCEQPTFDGPGPCDAVSGLSGARGATRVTGVVRHKHVDGLDRRFDRRVRCRLRSATSARRKVEASISVRYLPESKSFGVTAHNPLNTVLSLFPSQCPRQGDSIDRVLDFYAMPGFSFDPAYGPDRWFTSREVVVPSAVFHRSSVIRIPLRLTSAGRSPKRCAVQNPSFERCRARGSWRGALVFRVRG